MKSAKLGYILFISPRTCVFLVEYPRAVGKHFNFVAQKVPKTWNPLVVLRWAQFALGSDGPV